MKCCGYASRLGKDTVEDLELRGGGVGMFGDRVNDVVDEKESLEEAEPHILLPADNNALEDGKNAPTALFDLDELSAAKPKLTSGLENVYTVELPVFVESDVEIFLLGGRTIPGNAPFEANGISPKLMMDCDFLTPLESGDWSPPTDDSAEVMTADFGEAAMSFGNGARDEIDNREGVSRFFPISAQQRLARL
ncbi:hypothetical protein HDU84_002394 [Entophlyctis sp. JEL0112]|nr:hypothetical protein HDU84_002394 [Entophlyctis sp. JEL0112]